MTRPNPHRMTLIASLLLTTLTLVAQTQPATRSAATTTRPNSQPAKPEPVTLTGAGKTIGFIQTGAESAWRLAHTFSIKEEAQKRGYHLQFVDANQKPEAQIAAVRNFINQRVDAIFIAPLMIDGWNTVLAEAKAANIPIVLLDRKVAVPDNLYATLLASDFTEEGRRAARWLAQKTNGQAGIFELYGSPGSAPAEDRNKGFAEILREKPGMKIIKSQTAEFQRAKGKEVTAAFLKTPEAAQCAAIFAHNDDMALGAIQAVKEAGKRPGKDILIVSIDGIRDILQAIANGEANCTIDCNPEHGPQAFDTLDAVLAGKELNKFIPIDEGAIDQDNAAKILPTRKY